MNKLTPENVLSGALLKGDFVSVECKRQCDPTTYPNNPLEPIDVRKFSEYFTKCTGSLNSIMKRSPKPENGILQPVVKNKIGYVGRVGFSRSNYGCAKNAKYADNGNAYAILHPKHVSLVCKRDKRLMVQDFMNVKSDIIMQFHHLKVQAMRFVEDQVSVSDAFIVAYKRPNPYNCGYTDSGYMLLNSRVVMKDQILFSIKDNNEYFGDYNHGVERSIRSCYGKSETDSLIITCHIREPREMINIDEVEYDNSYYQTALFRVTIEGSTHSALSLQLEIFNFQFDGIHIVKMVDALLPAYSKLRDNFNEMLEEVKDKYLGEFLLNELCDTESAI